MISILAILVFVIVLSLLIYLAVRSEIVYRERMRVIKLISEQCSLDIAHGYYTEWAWRFDALDNITNLNMIFSFKPVKSFFEGAACLRPMDYEHSNS